jgi:hypothetical protein
VQLIAEWVFTRSMSKITQLTKLAPSFNESYFPRGAPLIFMSNVELIVR